MTNEQITVTPELLEQLAEKSKLPLKYLTELWEEKKAEAETESAALYNLSTALKAQVRSPAVPCEGVLFEITEPFDYRTGPKYAQLKALKALCEKEGQETWSNPSQATIKQLIAKGMVDSNCMEGQPLIWLDTVAQSKAGKDNPNFSKPWPPATETTMMDICGIVKPSIPVNGQEIPMEAFSITISDSEWFEAKPGINNISCVKDLQAFKPFDTKLIYHIAEGENAPYYSISTTTEFTFDEGTTMDIMALCRKYMPQQVQSIETLQAFYDKFGGKQDSPSVIFEGGVQNMRLNEGILPDLRIDVPESIPIDFARGTRAIFIGAVKQKPVWVKGEGNEKGHNHPTEKELYVEVHTIYPIPGLTIIAKKAEELSGEQAEGWG
jgi:hypothetical protein